MSRVGKKPIIVPQGIEVKLETDATSQIQKVGVKGSKGQLSLSLPAGVSLKQEDGKLVFAVADEQNVKERAFWGLARTLVNNAIVGVSQGFSKELEINGVGFKAALQGKKLVLNVGFSHPVEYALPEGINAEVDKNNIKIFGIDKQLVGQTAAEIRSIKKPEPYKGKGIKYIDEQIRRKAGKVVKSA
ncbi:MAG: 50S ribosomal protein L6 [Patescibacteria group bacterium]|nr:50S ribosomal protein L6 [Patescibacteria group bacterium]